MEDTVYDFNTKHYKINKYNFIIMIIKTKLIG